PAPTSAFQVKGDALLPPNRMHKTQGWSPVPPPRDDAVTRLRPATAAPTLHLRSHLPSCNGFPLPTCFWSLCTRAGPVARNRGADCILYLLKPPPTAQARHPGAADLVQCAPAVDATSHSGRVPQGGLSPLLFRRIVRPPPVGRGSPTRPPGRHLCQMRMRRTRRSP